MFGIKTDWLKKIDYPLDYSTKYLYMIKNIAGFDKWQAYDSPPYLQCVARSSGSSLVLRIVSL